jgi:hypothetical protein
MPRGLLFSGALALLLGGCATSVDTERRAEAHDQRARQEAAYQNYDQAAEQKHEADRLHAKAARERAEENSEAVLPPPPPPAGDYPPPPPPVVVPVP